jgi:hypothetical protein
MMEWAVVATGCSTGAGFQPDPVSVTAPSTDWLSDLGANLSQELCADGSVFRTCYALGPEECRSHAMESIAGCEASLGPTIPATLDEEAGVRLGADIGSCAGERLAESLDPSAVTRLGMATPECQQMLGAL